MYSITTEKLDNQTYNDLQMSHATTIYVVFKKLLERQLRKESFCN